MPTSRSPRRSRPAASRTRRRSRSAGSRPTLCETPEGAAKALGDIDGIVVPGGFGIRGIEGKLGALKFAREQGIPTLGLCLGPAVHGDRVRAPRRGHRGRVVERVRPRHRVPGHRDDGRAGRHPRPAATWAARCASACTRPISPRARSRPSCTARRRVEERHRHRYEVNNRYRDADRRGGPRASRASRPTATSSSTSSCRATCTRTTSPRRRTPSCARGRPTRIRCSADSSARRSSVTVRASCSTSTNG